MLWKGNAAGQSVKSGFGKVTETAIYVGDGLGTVYSDSAVAKIMSTVTIPANTFQAGDLVKLSGAVKITGITGTPRFKVNTVSFGGVHELAYSGTAPLVAVDDYFYWSVEMRLRTLSPNHDALFDTIGNLWYVVAASDTETLQSVTSDDGATIATNVDIAVTVEGDWGTGHASNTATAVMHEVQIVRP